jgi:hypothetical protein
MVAEAADVAMNLRRVNLSFFTSASSCLDFSWLPGMQDD